MGFIIIDRANIRNTTNDTSESIVLSGVSVSIKRRAERSIWQKKEQTQLNQLLENVLEKYSSLKDPYFTNFIYTSRFSHNNKSEADLMKESGTYSELQLFREVLVRKGFNELEQLPELLDKLLLTTAFNALFMALLRKLKDILNLHLPNL